MLVVDDERDVRRLLERILRRAGHAVDAVATAADALSRVDAGGTDVVLCDLILAESHGLELIGELARHEARPASVAVTGHAHPEVVAQALAAGAVGFVAKPFKPTDIEIAIQQALHRREDEEAAAARQRQIEQELRYRADFDPLTELFNRARFNEEFEKYLAGMSEPEEEAALLICDLDHFKLVNDSLGHAAGDAVLRRAARILRSRLGPCDLAARLGGDEFAVLLADISAPAALEVAHTIQEMLSDPSARPASSASVGVVTFHAREDATSDDLLVAADVALYDAKESGRNAVALYRGPKVASLTWIDRIRSAIADEGLVTYSQPVVDLRTGGIHTEELLIRMRDCDGRIIEPGAFLPTAERFGLVEEIDAWMLGSALRLARTGRAVSVNISASTMQKGTIADVISAARDEGVDPRRLTIEITETMAVSNLDAVRELSARLRSLGCGLALDDFGTGFGSLTYLRHLPITSIKIDRDFVRDLARNRADQRMVKAIVEIAQAAGLATVAEGIEDVMALDFLRRHGVDLGQGYYLGRPAPIAALPPAISPGATTLLTASSRMPSRPGSGPTPSVQHPERKPA